MYWKMPYEALAARGILPDLYNISIAVPPPISKIYIPTYESSLFTVQGLTILVG